MCIRDRYSSHSSRSRRSRAVGRIHEGVSRRAAAVQHSVGTVVCGTGRRQQGAQLLYRADDGGYAGGARPAVPEGRQGGVEAQAEAEVTDDSMGGARAIEHRTVSRKTPGDGKLEITKSAAERLEPLGAQFSLLVDGKHGDGALGTMPCTCRGHDKPHVHYFVESDLL